MQKTKSITSIEEKMSAMEPDSLRYHVLESARNFKTSWIELGRSLYTVFKDKMFKSWDYSTFEIYVAKEIGIRKETAMKLLRSYYFLEKEEPAYLSKERESGEDIASVPTYEAVDVLRQAKAKKIGSADYAKLRQQALGGRDAREVKKDLTALIRQREELSPEEAWEKKRSASLKRFVSTLKSLRREIEESKLLPAAVLKETDALIAKIESEI